MLHTCSTEYQQCLHILSPGQHGFVCPHPLSIPVIEKGKLNCQPSLQIWEWVKAFCAKTGASGQLCFDFMRDGSDGRMYAFECNPRTSTILLNFYDHDHVAQAFFNAQVASLSSGLPSCRRMLKNLSKCIAYERTEVVLH